jgi:hypothetical protein
MERYICIHGHFYQPPRENSWLEAIEIQDSAYPYHDWNERVTAECYAPNSASRIIDGEGRILDIVSNYAKISFNFGPTLLSWMETYTPDVYQAILEADRQSIEWRSGHGSAVAQVYSHIIMPLANSRDKRTQVIWGIKDFEYRFKRFPEGMWLSETAVDIETLEILAEHGIKFTILAPHQAQRVRRIGTGKWKDVSGSRIDPTRAYLCKLPSGRKINMFFYDGPISQAVAFEKLLIRGEDFASRLLSGFSFLRNWPQILNIATDGETYGHHHRFGDMAIAYALNYIENNGLARLTNYGEYLERHPPAHEVQIYENSSWSCIHGIERWRSNCGCNSGGHPEWNQEWREPLRNALDWLREQLAFKYELKAKEYLKNPWNARDDYIDLVCDRSEDNVNKFFEKHAARNLSNDEKVIVLKLLEMQRHAMLMYTSCGWFFDEISGIETVQVIQYAGRAIQLSEDLFKDNLENAFKVRLSAAKSNLPEHGNGSHIYEKFVKPALIDLKNVGAHYAVSSIFEDYVDRTTIFSYEVAKEDYQRIEAGKTRLAVGRISVVSKVTRESETISFCVLHLGNHALNGGVRTFLGHEAYKSMKYEIITAFERGEFADIVRMMDKHFGMHTYSLIHLFRDEQRKVLNLLISKTIEDFVESYRAIYDNNRILMGFLQETGMPVPKAFRTAAEFTLNFGIKRAFSEENIDADRVRNLISEIKKWNVSFDSLDIEFIVRHRLEKMMEKLYANPSDFTQLQNIQKVLELLKLMPVEINYWQVQNIYYRMAKKVYSEFLVKAKAGDEDAARWIETFKYLGQMLFF